MLFLAPFMAAIADAVSVAVDKVALGRLKLPVKSFIPLLFVFLFVITSCFVPFLGTINVELAFQTKYMIFFALMLGLASMGNVFYYQSIQKEKLYEHQMIMMLFPAVTILLASLLIPGEYDGKIFFVSILAIGSLMVSKLERGHFKMDHYSINLLIAVLLMSCEMLIIKELLMVYSPVALYAVRTGFLAVLFVSFYRPRLVAIPAESAKYVLGSAALGAVFMILRYYGYQSLGLVHTTIVLLMAPLLVYLASAKFFGEKLRPRTICATIIIMGCISYVTIISALSS